MFYAFIIRSYLVRQFDLDKADNCEESNNINKIPRAIERRKSGAKRKQFNFLF